MISRLLTIRTLKIGHFWLTTMFAVNCFWHFRSSMAGTSFALAATRGPMFRYSCHGGIITGN